VDCIVPLQTFIGKALLKIISLTKLMGIDWYGNA
jgi:hypothetical protein